MLKQRVSYLKENLKRKVSHKIERTDVTAVTHERSLWVNLSWDVLNENNGTINGLMITLDNIQENLLYSVTSKVFF